MPITKKITKKQEFTLESGESLVVKVDNNEIFTHTPDIDRKALVIIKITDEIA